MSDHIPDPGKMVSARDEAVERALLAAWCAPIKGVTDEDAFLAALRTAGFVIEQDWQPIETAPRDGTIIDLWFSGDAWNCRMPGFVWRPGMNFWHNETTHQSYNESPLITHWRPLPTPPEGQP